MLDIVAKIIIGLFLVLMIIVVVLSFVSNNNEATYKLALITSLVGIVAVIFDEKRNRD